MKGKPNTRKPNLQRGGNVSTYLEYDLLLQLQKEALRKKESLGGIMRKALIAYLFPKKLKR